MEQYIEIINNYANQFQNTLESEYQNKEELTNAFKNYLATDVKIKLEMDPEGLDRNEFILRWLQKDAERIIKMPTSYKESKLLEDINFEKLRFLSFDLYQKALEKVNNPNITMSEEEYKKYQKVLNEYYNNAKSFNKEEAKYLLSEALLDAKYLYEKESKITSVRIGLQLMNEKVK